MDYFCSCSNDEVKYFVRFNITDHPPTVLLLEQTKIKSLSLWNLYTRLKIKTCFNDFLKGTRTNKITYRENQTETIEPLENTIC